MRSYRYWIATKSRSKGAAAGKRILFLTAGNSSVASTRVRVLEYITELTKVGFSCQVLPSFSLFPDRSRSGKNFLWRFQYIIARKLRKPAEVLRALLAVAIASHFDIVFVQKIILPPVLQKILLIHTPKIVFDFDDAIFNSPEYYGKEAWLVNQLAACSLVLAGNEWLAGYARQYSKNVIVFPTPVDTARLVPSVNSKKNNDTVVVGWIGSPSTLPQLEMLSTVFDKITNKYSNLKFLVIGIDGSKLGNGRVEYRPWSESNELEYLRQMDIGVMPLRDEPSTRGKCGYKLLQYMACGLPVIASPVGVNKEIVYEGENGYLATSESEWIDKLALLIENPELRKNLGLQGRQFVEENYSYQVLAPRLINALYSPFE